MRRPLALALAFTTFAAGCAADPGDDAATAESAVEVHAPGLWAGLASYAMERWVADPCNDGRHRLDTNPIGYGEWERQRAGIRNVCFEVWKPGVTDTENPDFWRLLDVQVHYRHAGATEWKQAYVPSIDRRGNNRRYAWSLDVALDPMFMASSVADPRAPFEIAQETERAVLARADLEFYFTVNGHELSTSASTPFRVAYSKWLEKPSMPAREGGHVLHPSVECAGGALRLGSGAGYLVADVADQAAVAALGAALDDARISAARVSASGPEGARVLSIGFSSIAATPAGELPRYVDGYYAYAPRAEARQTAPGEVTVTVKAYDRTTKRLEDLSYTFAGCNAL